MTGHEKNRPGELAPEAPPEEPLSDTQADLHEEGKSLSDDDKDLSEKLAEILERSEHD